MHATMHAGSRLERRGKQEGRGTEPFLNIVTNTTNKITAPVGTIDDNDKNKR